MREEEVRFFQQTRPFEPFTIHLADGRTFEIRHLDAISIVPRGRAVIVQNQDRLHEHLSLPMIVSLRPLKPLPEKKKR